MKPKPKKMAYKILKVSWVILGILVLIWNIYWFVRVKIMYDYTFIINVMMFAFGVIALISYAVSTFLFLLIKFIIKKVKKK
ncbi:MAG: hypothetical protein AABW47_03545 [Nanoarchaeota archaeon]